MIQYIKYGSLCLAIVVVLALFIWEKEGGQLKLAAANMAIEGELTANEVKSTSTTTLLEEPRYQGRDTQGREWKVSAQRALQTGDLQTGSITLNQVTAQYLDADNSTDLSFLAEKGVYQRPSHTTSETLTLHDNVTVTGFGLKLHTEELTTHIKSRLIYGPKPVRLVGNYQGMHLDLNAGQFRMNKDQTITLSGGLKARLTAINK